MLLTRNDISRFQIDPRAVELLPESVARERQVLPVRFTDAVLHLVVPAEAGLGSDDTIDALRFVLGRPFTIEYADTDDLKPFVDFYYTAIYSEITNCGTEFKFRCPKRWAELNPTADVRVRNCPVCERRVTFCADVNELLQLAAKNDCVAFYDRSQESEFLGLPESV